MIVLGVGACLAKTTTQAAPIASPAAPDAGSAAAPPAAACPARAALAAAALSFVPRQRTVDLWFVPLTGPRPNKVATLKRAPDSPVTGVAVPETDRVAVVVTPRRDRDPTWSGVMYIVAPGEKPRAVLENVYAGGAPAAGKGGYVYAVVGAAGAERGAGDQSAGYRHDVLDVVEVDARRGTKRTFHAGTGDALILAGVTGDDLIAYRVGSAPPQRKPDAQPGAPGEIVAIDVRGGQLRTVLSPAPPLARDFSLDPAARKLWFAAPRAAAAKGESPWAVYQLDLTTRQLSVAAGGPSMGLTPFHWPGGAVAYSCAGAADADQAPNLCVARGRGQVETLRPLGPGRDQLQAIVCTSAGNVALGVHESGGPFGAPFAWNLDEPRARIIDLPTGRVVFAGAVTQPALP